MVKKFICDMYELRPRYMDEIGIQEYMVEVSDDVDYLLGALVIEDKHYTDLADEACDLLEESSGVQPVLDIHGDGAYITGINGDLLYLQFIANEHKSNKLYTLNLMLGEVDDINFDVDFIDVFNSILDDFLASGITDNKCRTEYGEPVTEGDELSNEDYRHSGVYNGVGKEFADRFTKVRIPDDFESNYSSKYIQSFTS